MSNDPFQPSLDLINTLIEFDKRIEPCPSCGAKLYWRMPPPPEPVRVWCEQCGYEVRGRPEAS